jgi:hypothetical protein
MLVKIIILKLQMHADLVPCVKNFRQLGEHKRLYFIFTALDVLREAATSLAVSLP